MAIVLTPEQREAEEALSNAMHKYMNAWGLLKDGKVIMSHVHVVETTQLMEDPEPDLESYTVFTNNGERLSVAKGLLLQGLKEVQPDSDYFGPD